MKFGSENTEHIFIDACRGGRFRSFNADSLRYKLPNIKSLFLNMKSETLGDLIINSFQHQLKSLVICGTKLVLRNTPSFPKLQSLILNRISDYNPFSSVKTLRRARFIIDFDPQNSIDDAINLVCKQKKLKYFALTVQNMKSLDGFIQIVNALKKQRCVESQAKYLRIELNFYMASSINTLCNPGNFVYTVPIKREWD